MADYSFNMTAGNLAGVFFGYQSGSFGSIDAEPIGGQTLSVCLYDPGNIAGQGQSYIAFNTDLTSLLTTQTVWIDSVQYAPGTGWTYNSGNDTTYYTPASAWSFSDTVSYFIEIKDGGGGGGGVPWYKRARRFAGGMNRPMTGGFDG